MSTRLLSASALSSRGDPIPFTSLGSRVLFYGPNGKLWVTEGATSNTKPLHSTVSPGGVWVRLGAGVCFPGYEVQNGWEVWCSEGTTATTRAWTRFDYFEALGAGRVAFNVVAFKNRRYFLATDGLTPSQIWSTDGTVTGTRPIGECANCPEEPELLGVLGPRLLLHGYGRDGYGLFVSDGTATGTKPLPVCPGCEAWSRVVLSGRFAFVVAEESSGADGPTYLYRTNGTQQGTIRLLESPQIAADFTVVQRNPSSWWIGGAGIGVARLSITNGTRPGTQALTPLLGTSELGSNPQALLGLGGGAFFCADLEGYGWWTSLWFAHGPYSALDMNNDWGCDITHLRGTSSLAFWSDYESGSWTRSDGSPSGTFRVLPQDSVSNVTGSATVGGRVAFVTRQNDESFALFRSDGTADGTRKVVDLPGEPAELSGTETEAHFFAHDKLWRSDLTAEGTRPVLQPFEPAAAGPVLRYGSLLIVHGANRSRLSWLPAEGATGLRTLAEDPRLHYAYEPKIHQRWLYFWGRGTASSTRHLARVDLDHLVATGISVPEVLATFEPPPSTYRGSHTGRFAVLADGRLAFAANDPQYGEELFVTDGTAVGTRRVSDILPGPQGGVFSDPVPLAGGVVFSAHDGQHGVELWWSDGTPTGATLVDDLYPGLGSAFPSGLLVSGDRVYFAAEDGKIGRELWVVEP